MSLGGHPLRDLRPVVSLACLPPPVWPPTQGPPPPPQHLPSYLVAPPSSTKCPLVPLPKLASTSFHVGYYVPPSVEPGDPYGGLETVWNKQFELLFRNLPNLWFFGPTDTRPTGWCVFKDVAKVRFSCQRCSHGWTSMYGLVLFFYRWDIAANQGHVRFLLMGQKCKQCHPNVFETPMWYPEEAQKVMTNLYHKVASHVYQLQTPPLIHDRRHGRPRHRHDAHMCEGCTHGMCKNSKPVLTSRLCLAIPAARQGL